MMPDEDDNIFGRCFGLMDSGVDRQGMIDYLHSQGVTVTEALVILGKLYGLSVEDARCVIVNHPAWQAEVRALDRKPGSLAEWMTRPEQPDA